MYRVAELAGMNRAVLGAYRRFQESITVRNSIAGGLGESYRKTTSIPQGDPWSMMCRAVLMRPVLSLVYQRGACPRILADDLFITAADSPVGRETNCRRKGLEQTGMHLSAIQIAFDTTHKHLQDIQDILGHVQNHTPHLACQ